MNKILLMDAGNSRLKWSSLEHDVIINANARFYGNKSPIDVLSSVLEELKSEHNQLLLVSVQGDEFAENARVLANRLKIHFSQVKSVPVMGSLINAYTTPSQLGADRFVALVAAVEKYKNQPCIIVDCGTAVTIDAVDTSGQHLGGLILPGLSICSESLVKGTQQLHLNQPLFSSSGLLAHDTNQAILKGSLYGLSGAIENICTRIETEMTNSQNQFSKVTRILCGGDAKTLSAQMGKAFSIEEDLIMQGLKAIVLNKFL